VAFFRMERLTAGRTRVVVDWLFDPAETERPHFDPSDSGRPFDVTNRQDFEVCCRAHIGMASPLYRGVLFGPDHAKSPIPRRSHGHRSQTWVTRTDQLFPQTRSSNQY
jgi:hypothetical protein